MPVPEEENKTPLSPSLASNVELSFPRRKLSAHSHKLLGSSVRFNSRRYFSNASDFLFKMTVVNGGGARVPQRYL
jgi:hypothetical protein